MPNESIQRVKELNTELDKLQKRSERRAKERITDDERASKIRAELDRISVAELLNVPGGVIVRYQQRDGSKRAKLDDIAGTLTVVRRTRGEVAFGTEMGIWTFPLTALMPATNKSQQGSTLTFR